MKNNLSDIHNIRTEYIKAELHEEQVSKNVIEQFSSWFDEARNAEVMEPNAMTLATTDADGQVDARTVLLKDIDKEGFVFFSNYTSKKGQEMQNNNKVALLFFWPELERQVRILGKVSKISSPESEEYFHSRPRGSQLGAWASHQSERVEDRGVIEKRLAHLEEKYGEGEIPLPDFWGGYRVIPHRVEFWQGRASRLHDRIVYEKRETDWDIYRISP